jgi:signal transduction histidine kinase
MLRQGAFEPHVREMQIASLLAANVERARENANQRGITITFDATDARAIVDPHATSRAFDELLDNAVGFSPEKATVTIHVAPDRITIEDSGSGIDADHIPNVFDEVKNRAHKPRRGVGRGLPLARAYARAQGGDVEVEPREDGGCRAILALRSSS